MAVVAWLIFLAAAVLEVGGDAIIRTGLRGNLNVPDSVLEGLKKLV